MTFFVSLKYSFFLKFFTLYLVDVRVLSGVANLASKYDCSNPFSFRDMTFFVIFQNKISKKIKSIFLQNMKNRNPVVGRYQSIFRGLRTLPPIMTAQVAVDFEI